MKKTYLCLAIPMLIISQLSFSQKTKTDANIFGHVTSEGIHIPFASVIVKGTTIGTITDETGHFRIINLPLGEIILEASMMGYKPQIKTFVAKENTTIEINFDLGQDILNLEEIVVTANRSEQKRTEAPVIVNTILPVIFNNSQSVTLGEALNFSPGLRLENNCQNCGFSQVRMNGMEGPYSQILINSRPIFSGLAGVYGLELIPSNMIERVEVVRGGGSALYGSNAIAGTINLILKDPGRDSYEVSVNYGLIGTGTKESGGLANDLQANFNTSVVSDDSKSGVSLYGFSRDRKMFDANDDGFSELAPIKNLTLGTRLFHRFGYRDKLSLDFFTIREERDGGNMQEYPIHERDIAEVVRHDFKTAALMYDKFFREEDLLSVYASGEFVERDSYYGAEQSLTDYGNSVDRTYNIGIQYKVFLGNSTLVGGMENTGGFLVDKKLGYPDYDNSTIVDGEIVEIPHMGNTTIADQASITTGVFIQYNLDLKKAKIALGARYDHYSIEDKEQEAQEKIRGMVFSPRVNLMYELTDNLKARLSYSQGYRAPQIFDEDLHIESSGSRQVLHRNDPDLKQETSHTVMASLDFNGLIGSVYTGFLVEGFYTRLLNPFANEFGEPDEDGTVIYTRINSEGGATVLGLNMEFKLRPVTSFSLSSGFTIQSGKYDKLQKFNERNFFRSPATYGFLAVDWDIACNTSLSVSGNYTGKMLIPYFGTETDPDIGELRKSDPFFDLGIKLRKDIRFNGTTLQLFGGVKNIFNSYQSDFDIGIDRDPAYIYGPLSPRTVYFGIRFGNFTF
jgi:outer membrane receptor for ferrienterochelin and colicins